MSVTAPLDIESPHEGSKAVDGIVIHDDISIQTNPVADDVNVGAEQPASTAFRDDPAMTFVYLGIVTLAIIIAAAAMLAL